MWRVHPGQERAARWALSWLEAYGAWRAGEGEQLKVERTGEVVRAALFHGGRRGGKTDLAIRIAILFAIMVPRSRVWIAAAAIPESEEVASNIRDMIPKEFLKGKPLGAPWWNWKLVNGSTIWIRTAHDPETLKRGRVDLAVLNEAQKMNERAYHNVRGGTHDRGGLTILAANPPNVASGQWVEDFYEEAQAGQRPAVTFLFDPRQNPTIDWAALEAQRSEMDDRTYRMEVLGEFVPREDVVWNAFRPANVQRAGQLILDRDGRPAPALFPGGKVLELVDCTADYLRLVGGRDFDTMVGLDFQLRPFVAATIRRFYRLPDWPLADALDYTIAEIAIAEGDEDDMVTALASYGLDPRRTICIGDASGEWQNEERTKGGRSFDMFRRRGWFNIFRPDRDSKANPNIMESVKLGNQRLCTADGRRSSFVDPECLHTIAALKRWENREGVPYRKSPYAHMSDAWRYPLWWLYPRKLVGKVEGKVVPRTPSSRREKMLKAGF